MSNDCFELEENQICFLLFCVNYSIFAGCYFLKPVVVLY